MLSHLGVVKQKRAVYLWRNFINVRVRSFVLIGAPCVFTVQYAGPLLTHMFTVSSALAGDEQDE